MKRTMTDIAGFKVDLSNCDREPIHVLGNIQPFGFLLAAGADWIVSRASANLADFIGVTAQEALGQPMTAIFSETALHTIRNRVTLLRGPDAVERLFGLPLVEGGAAFDVALHFSGDQFVIEAEPAVGEKLEASAMVRAMIARLSQADPMLGYLREGARQVRALTGFDRVMVYRFDEEGAGEVVAESVRPGVESFLGQHYPASDIPAQARKLYLRNIFRVIADVKAVPVPVIPALDSKGQALDQSLSVLRAVSPIHIEYLNNMGVAASLSISIILEGKLWGLIACHHYSPRLPSFAYRTAAELFGQMFSLMLESRERREAADYETRARSVTDRLMASMAQDNALLTSGPWIGEAIYDCIPADGVGVLLDGAVTLSGLTPAREQFLEIVGQLARMPPGEIFATDSIQNLIPHAAEYADRAAGMLAIPLSRSPRDYVVLFRAEQLRSVRWAGDPNKPVEVGPLGVRLTPRKSFELWSELVKGRSLPFTVAERRVAETVRSGMLEVLMRLSEAADQERARAHERQELLIAELNHRVRNILALIRGLVSQSRVGITQTIGDFTATLDDRIRALARAHDQITADRWGPARLRDLIEVEAGAYLGENKDRVALDGPNILIQPAAFTTMALVFHELMTNAAKYGALSDSGTVAVTWKLDRQGDLLLTWQEAGGPVVTVPSRRGFGSTIIAQSIPFDLGGRASIEYRLSGLYAEFCVPARHVAGVSGGTGEVARAAKPVADGQPLAGKCVLLVEDSMIIALEAEDTLKELGAVDVVTAANVARSLAVMKEQTFDFALLDVNLGAESSAGIAAELAARGISFAFATGYGEGAVFLGDYPNAPVINKPYDKNSMAGALAKMGLQ
jgi:light-regulated signal transduction histidine kinase (bacteriophytochrome)/CheY-like chemotaxis protein